MVLPDEFVEVRLRARPMTPEDRRAAIADAVIPIIRERGRDVSTRDLAEAAGVAEGTLFRAFGDKDSIIRAATERFLDPEPFRDALRGIDPDEPTEDKVRQVLELLRTRFEGVIGFMSAIGVQGPPPREDAARDEWLDILDQMFRPGELSVSTREFGYFARLVTFGSVIPLFNAAHPYDTEELVQIVLHGVLDRS